MRDCDTIAAIATPPGTAGVGIIRISGPQAPPIIDRLFRATRQPCPWDSHHLYHGDLLTLDGMTALDEVLAVWMRKPHSFTGEDVVEIHAHGNPVVLRRILSELIAAGCRPAGPGEFSKRAFLNGRMDLSQAEALATLIAARSERAAALGLSQMKGSLSQTLSGLRELLISALVPVEADIDFIEETDTRQASDVPPQIDTAIATISRLLSTRDIAKTITQGVDVVITGKPNVGKSSLLNSLTGRQRAIVTDIPGTTRDLITDMITLAGIPVHLTDTAGLRTAQDAIEKEGIARVHQQLAVADAVLIVLDASRPPDDEDEAIIELNRKTPGLIVINKCDLSVVWETTAMTSGDKAVVRVSAKSGMGLDELKDAIASLCESRHADDTHGELILQLRHEQALGRARANLNAACDMLKMGGAPELAAFEIREAIDALDEITGQRIQEEVLDAIFSQFCIGK